MIRPVLFTSHRPLERAENIKAIWDEYKGQKEFVRLNFTRDNDIFDNRRYKVLVTDEFVRKAPEVCIMVTHGIVGGKTYGLTQPLPYHVKEDARLLTWVITAGTLTKGLIALQCGVGIDKVLALGMPRTDQYFRNKYEKYEKRTYLYLPTYRGQLEGINPMLTTNFEKLDRMMNDNEQLLIKAHMIDVDPVMEYEHIKVISKDEPTAEYLMRSDVIITDYSSIVFDAYICGKPVVLFAKDSGVYTLNRRMCFKYPEGYSERFADNEEELIELVREAKEQTEIEKKLRGVVCDMCDGKSTKRVIDLITKEANKWA